jgi:hypothetical protein
VRPEVAGGLATTDQEEPFHCSTNVLYGLEAVNPTATQNVEVAQDAATRPGPPVDTGGESATAGVQFVALTVGGEL